MTNLINNYTDLGYADFAKNRLWKISCFFGIIIYR